MFVQPFLKNMYLCLLPNRVAYILPHICISYLTRYRTKRRSYWFRLYHRLWFRVSSISKMSKFFIVFFISTAVFFNLMFVSVQLVMDVYGFVRMCSYHFHSLLKSHTHSLVSSVCKYQETVQINTGYSKTLKACFCLSLNSF